MCSIVASHRPIVHSQSCQSSPLHKQVHVKADLSKCIWLSSCVLWKPPLGSVPIVILVLNTMQSHSRAQLLRGPRCLAIAMPPWFFLLFSSPRMRRKEYASSYSCLKCCLSSGFTLIPSWVPGSRAKIFENSRGFLTRMRLPSSDVPLPPQEGNGSGFWFPLSEEFQALRLLLPFLFSLALLLPCLAEGEAEAEWLQDAGLSDLLGDRASENDNIVLLSTLTKTQAAAVQRRLDTYSRSRRRKNKHPVRDVRDIFGVVSSEVCWCSGVSWKTFLRCGSWLGFLGLGLFLFPNRRLHLLSWNEAEIVEILHPGCSTEKLLQNLQIHKHPRDCWQTCV